MKKKSIPVVAAVLCAIMALLLCGCDMEYEQTDIEKQQEVAKGLENSQPTPTDIDYSLERYNLIRRSYWVNGQRDKALSLPCPVQKPTGYVVLFMEGVGIIDSYIVDGKVSSLNSFLTPDSEYYEVSTGSTTTHRNKWLSDVDGSYGENDAGIFFFTADGRYVEWTGTYLFSDIPYTVNNPMLTIKGG